MAFAGLSFLFFLAAGIWQKLSLFALALLVAALIIFVQALSLYELSSLLGIFPLLLSLLICAFAAFLFFTKEEQVNFSVNKKLPSVFFLFVCLVVLTPSLGFLATSTTLLLLQAWYLGFRSFLALGISALLWAFFLWGVFGRLLGLYDFL